MPNRIRSYIVKSFAELAIVFIVSSGPVAAQGFDWSQAGPSSAPTVRWAHSMAYDAARRNVVLFGGLNGSYLSDTWVWDGSVWANPMPSSSPVGRVWGKLAYDAARERVVLFGGERSGYLGDTWEWDGSAWLQRAPSVSPSGREGHGLAYDAARQRVVLFGGRNATYQNDTWEFDGTTWTLRSPTSSPSPRSYFSMAYDAARQRIVLFGGQGPAGYLGDTWEWEGSNWLARFSAHTPPARQSHSLTFDSSRQQTVLFGGHHGPGVVYLGDTWEWNGIDWAERLPSFSPQARDTQAMAYDAAREQVVLNGGHGTIAYGDTWLVANAGAAEYGTGCGSPNLGLQRHATLRPLVGQTCGATIVNSPSIIAGVTMGWSNQFYGPFALPVPLDSIGMSGCMLWHSAEIIGLGASPVTPNTLSFAFTIPNQSALLGSHVYLQAYALAPGQNPLQVVASNGIDWRLGSF